MKSTSIRADSGRESRKPDPTMKTPRAGTNKILYALVAITIAAIGFGVYRSQPSLARPQAVQVSASAQPASLVSMRPFVDFGAVSMAAGKVSTRYLVKNAGGTPLTLKRIYTSCMCTTAVLRTSDASFGPFGMPGMGQATTLKTVLAPGAIANLEVVFDPAAHGPSGLGRVERSITLEGEGAQPLELRFVAMVKP